MTNKELDKLKELALDYRANAVFTSWDCYDKDPKKWAENLNIIFLPIGFGGIKKSDKYTFFYCHYSQRHQLPSGINGFPMFDRVQCLTKEKEDKLREILIALEDQDKIALNKIK